MLEKMGWTVGKGLGAKEQGATEHVKVKVKNDQVGKYRLFNDFFTQQTISIYNFICRHWI